MSFSDFSLSQQLQKVLEAQQFTTPTPIQAKAIPEVLAGHDVMASAPTGTGKTAAYVLPLLERLSVSASGQNSTHPRVLVLTPTRELAAQVQSSVRLFGTHLPLRSTTVFGGVSQHRQIKALARGVDVLVATPGRLIDHLSQGTVSLAQVQALVLDEADRMLDMGFQPALKRIMPHLPKQRQTLLFSATFAGSIKNLAADFLHDPKRIEVSAPNAVAATVSHRVHPVDATQKRDALLHLIAEDDRRQALVFCRTKRGCDARARFLSKYGVKVAAIHGNKSQNRRTRTLADFKAGRITVLVATDIAARGLDVKQLPLVINHDLPMVAEDYIHRIGRTGRAGAEGLAVSLVSQEEAGLLRDIQKLLTQPIDIQPLAGFEPSTPLVLDAKPARKRHSRGKKKPHARRSHNKGKPTSRTRTHSHKRPQSRQRRRSKSL